MLRPHRDKESPVNPSITAEDLWPLVQKLSPEELIRLSRLALRSDEDTLAWEGEGWEEFYAAR